MKWKKKISLKEIIEKDLETAAYYGISPLDFYKLTRKELEIYIKSQNKLYEDKIKGQNEFQEILFANLSATIANFSMTKRKNKKYKASDFLSKKRNNKKEKLTKKEKESMTQSPNAMAAALKCVTLMNSNK